jgi:pimeloyl-ACP methyl ester carboxylesterase
MLRAARFAARLARTDPGGLAPRALAHGGIPCDVYEPAGRGDARTTVVAVHGVTVNGKDDPRLRGFARALAASRSRCLVPTLPGLAAVRRDPSDVDALARLLADAPGDRDIVVVGFSHGASLALLAAARPPAAPRVRHVLSFGAYHSLSRVAAALRALPEPRKRRDRDDIVYAHLVEARRRADELRLAPGVVAAADDLLRRYCGAASEDEKLRFFEDHLRPLELARRPDPAADALHAALSPAGQLGAITCPVDLVHDPNDLLVPVSEAHALLEELRLAAPNRPHRLLVTTLVQHVSAAGVMRPREGLRLLAMLAPLVGG